ncbi:MAG: XdhC family protein [Leptolyngbyaceae cyanobacterium]
MALEFYQTLAKNLRSQPVVVATVIATKGSVPREVGAKMLIGADWTLDTIGGGAGEAKIIQQGRSLLASGNKHQTTIDLTGDATLVKEGICGGQMSLWLERWLGAEAVELAGAIATALQEGQALQLNTPFASNQIPTLTPAARTAFNPQLTATAFIEPLHPSALLLIVGAGHVGKALAQVAHIAGFQIAVQDDRPAFANAAHYPQAQVIFTDPIEQTLQQICPHPNLFVALVTRGYPFDLAALTSLYQHKVTCRYLGMIGSQKRVQTVVRSLQAQGIATPQLARLHAPIGLEIGALTPGEIAISICAELIRVRRGDQAILNPV